KISSTILSTYHPNHRNLHSFPTRRSSDLDTNSSRTSEAALWPSTYISPLSNSTPCIRKDRISSKSLMRLSICLWKRFCLFVCRRSEERFSRNAETDLVCRLLLEKNIYNIV